MPGAQDYVELTSWTPNLCIHFKRWFMRTFNSIASLLWISASVRDCTAVSITLHAAIMVVYSVTIKSVLVLLVMFVTM